VTRDIDEVRKLDYPVLSRGVSCSDVKGMAVVENHNKPIIINGVTIAPGDLVFADIGGIVVVPWIHEMEILERAVQIVTKEKNILAQILGNYSAFSIYQNKGAF
jgi:regulator of RNase E activity RraA